ncbi:MAG TPA: hypothetical protein VLF39_04185 [Candidatus Saccharimonadales bacterium]|nr:hypothetical protein [Candidatus Saccharimonadales bacterium]
MSIINKTVKNQTKPVTQFDVAWAKLQVLWQKLTKFADKHPKLTQCLKFVIVFTVFGLIVWNTIDPDFGWHLQAGRYILAHWVPGHDVFTYTARNYRWIDHEWLSDVINALIFNRISYIGLTLVFAGVWTSALFVTGKRYLITMLLAAIAIQPYVSVRPMAWSALLLAVLIRLSESKRLRSKFIFLMPLIIMLWTNLHGGFIIGLAYIGFLLIKERDWLWLKIFGLSILATFINPYGPRLYFEVFTTLFDSQLHWQIVEWRPFLIFWQSQAYISLWIAGTILYTKKKFDDLFTFDKLLFLAGLSSTRHIILFVIAAMPKLEDYAKQARKNIPKKPKLRVKVVLVILVLIVLGDVGYGVYRSGVSWIPQKYDISTDFTVYTYLKDHPCSGNIFNSYNLGGFLIWQLPNQPIYIDGRMPSWRNEQGQKYFNIYTKIFSDDRLRKSEFSKYDVKCALLLRDNQTNKLVGRLENEHWHQTYITSEAILLEN